MNKVQKKILKLMTLAVISCQLIGYEYDFVNMIGDPIVLKINQSRTDKKDYYQIVFPGKTVKQTYPMGNAYCLATTGIQWAPYDPTAPLKGGLNLVDKSNGRIPENKQREFGDKVAHEYAFIPVEIIMQPNEVYTQIRKAAAQLLKGIDSFACQTLSEVKQFMSQSSGSGGSSLPGGGSSLPTKEKVDKESQVIDLLDNLQQLISSYDWDSPNPAQQAKLKKQVEDLVSGNNVKLLKDEALDVGQISMLKGALTFKANSTKALDIINSTLQTIASRTRSVKIDMAAGSNINTLMGISDSSSMYSGGGSSMYSSSSQSTTPKNCDFGLGKIGKASGKLAGTTLCTSREFIIYYKVDNDGIPMTGKYLGRPVLTATTVEGQ